MPEDQAADRFEGRVIDAVDRETGEILGQIKTEKRVKTKNVPGFTSGYVQIAQTVFTKYAIGKTVSELRVLFALLARVDYGNVLNVCQSGLAKQLGTTRQVVNRSIHSLLRDGILEIEGQAGRNKIYCFNPDLVWRGSWLGHRVKLRERAANQAQASRDARNADNLARLRIARMGLIAQHPQPVPRSAKSGYKGVSVWRGKYRARISSHNHIINLGTYDTPEAAHDAYLAAKRELQIHKPADKR